MTSDSADDDDLIALHEEMVAPPRVRELYNARYQVPTHAARGRLILQAATLAVMTTVVGIVGVSLAAHRTTAGPPQGTASQHLVAPGTASSTASPARTTIAPPGPTGAHHSPTSLPVTPGPSPTPTSPAATPTPQPGPCPSDTVVKSGTVMPGTLDNPYPFYPTAPTLCATLTWQGASVLDLVVYDASGSKVLTQDSSGRSTETVMLSVTPGDEYLIKARADDKVGTSTYTLTVHE